MFWKLASAIIAFLEGAFANSRRRARCCGNSTRQCTSKPDDEPEAHVHAHKEEAPQVEENNEEEEAEGGRGSRRGFPTTAPQKKSEPKKAPKEKEATSHNLIKKRLSCFSRY